MRVEYGGHACVRLSDEKFSLIIDPFCDIGYKVSLSSADFCLTSHNHFDHNATHEVDVKQVIDESAYGDFPWLRVIPSYHDEVCGKKRGKNNIFVINFDGIKVCHLGDLGEPFNEKLCDQMGKIDILFIPVGGKYTVDAIESIKYVKKINPKIVIPIHYKTARSTVDIAGKESFLANFTNIKKVSRIFEIVSLPAETLVYDIDDKDF